MPCQRTTGSPIPSRGQKIYRPFFVRRLWSEKPPPLTSRPSGSTAKDRTGLPCWRITGSPTSSHGQTLIWPSSPPLASRPSASTARDYAQLLPQDHGLAHSVSGPEFDLAVDAAAGQPSVSRNRQGQNRAVPG